MSSIKFKSFKNHFSSFAIDLEHLKKFPPFCPPFCTPYTPPRIFGQKAAILGPPIPLPEFETRGDV